jgi:hypothetical protein
MKVAAGDVLAGMSWKGGKESVKTERVVYFAKRLSSGVSAESILWS